MSYVGKSINFKRRYIRHLKNAENKINRYLYDAMNYYGYDSFKLILLEDLGEITKNEINEKERFWIKKLNTIIPNGYNMTEGGDGGNTIDNWPLEKKQELWKKQAESRKGMILTDDHKQKIGKANKKSWSNKSQEEKQEHSKRIKKWAIDNNIKPPKHTLFKKGQNGMFKDKKHSFMAKNKMSKARKGKTYDQIFKDKNTVDKRKKELREGFTGVNNPNYIEFTKEQKINIINKILSNLKINMSDLSAYFNISEFMIRKFLHESGIENFQKFKQLKDENQKKNLLLQIIDDMISS